MHVAPHPSQSDGRPGVRVHLLAGRWLDISSRKSLVPATLAQEEREGTERARKAEALPLFCLTRESPTHGYVDASAISSTERFSWDVSFEFKMHLNPTPQVWYLSSVAASPPNSEEERRPGPGHAHQGATPRRTEEFRWGPAIFGDCLFLLKTLALKLPVKVDW